MKLMYFFDKTVKPHLMKGTKSCNPAETGVLEGGIRCIRQHDVNLWFYSKGETTIAFDAGHLNFPGLDEEFRKIGLHPSKIEHLFITHSDVDHCGGIDVCGKNIFPGAKVYLGAEEEAYLHRSIYRFKRFGVPIKNCVTLHKGYRKLNDQEIVRVGEISVQAFHVPGHTVGHLCYIVDDKVLISGDCLAINDEGGYSFFDFFTQYPEWNKRSLARLKKIVQKSGVQYVCTGHSGFHTDIEKVFRHIDKSASFSRKKPFDKHAPWDIRK